MSRAKFSFFSQYSSVYGIVYALRGDGIPDKRIAQALRSNNQRQALRIALGSSSARHRYLALGLLFLKERLHWLPPFQVMLWVFRIIGPSRSWFAYLQQQNRSSLVLTKEILGQTPSRAELILDVGSGLGDLPKMFPVNRKRRWICIDKNFFSLFLAQLYNKRQDITYVCGDIELQRLFPDRTFERVVCADCFAYIYEKPAFTHQVHRLLKSKGTFVMVNVHEEQRGTESWGYGIPHHQMQGILRKLFTTFSWYDVRQPKAGPIRRFSLLDSTNYSFVAYK